MTQQPVIQLKNVSIALGRRTILQDMSITLDEGEFVAVLGPNGAGKSTLLKMLLGLLKPGAGNIQVLGATPHRGNAEIGYAPQHRVLDADLALRARDIVGFGLDGNHWGIGLPGRASRKRNALIDKVLDEVDAWAFAEAPVGQLSGGEQQRLLIAQALLTNPRLLLLDEPLSNLDLTHQQEIVSLVARVCRSRNVTVLLVSHDINPLLPVVDRVLYIANSHSAIGTLDEVITNTTLTKLYGSPVQVIHALNRVFVVGCEQ